MFKSLREKLNIFKKKAKEEIEKEELPSHQPSADPTPGKKESKFLKKARKKEQVKRNKKGIDQDRGPKEAGDDDLSLNGSIQSSGLSGEQALRGDEPLFKESRGLFAKKISEKKLEDIMFDLEMGLMESDVAQPVVERIKDYLMEELTGAKVDRKTDLDQLIEDALRNSIRRVLATQKFDFNSFLKNTKKPITIMFVGVNGTGKTTAIARIAYMLKNMNITCILAAGDTFRAGAIEQLTRHAENLNLKIIKNKAGSDPAAVAYDALEHAKARMKDVVLLDTAGRMQTNINLMDEMKKIKRVAKPDLIVFVGDSLAGNDAVIQAQKFDEAVGVNGAILTKIDADAKGGAALSIAYTIGKPILFIGTGQDYEDLIPFDPDWMTERLFEE
jgi:fused signal recognition particle receptor